MGKLLLISLFSIWLPELGHAKGKVVYFLEAHCERGQTPRFFHSAPKVRVGEVPPCSLFRFEATLAEYKQRLKLLRRGSGQWVAVPARTSTGQGSLFIYDHYLGYSLIDPTLHPVELGFKRDSTAVITIFRQPGRNSWRHCLTEPQDCIAWPGQHSQLKLVDSLVLNSEDRGWQVYYKVHYRYPGMNGQLREGQGWVPAFAVQRKIGDFPLLTMLFESDVTPVVAREKVAEIIQKTEQAIIQKSEQTMARHMSLSGTVSPEDLSQRFSRWTKPAEPVASARRAPASDMGPGVALEKKPQQGSVLNLKIDIQVDVRLGIHDLQKTSSTSAGAQVNESAMRIGISGIAPLFLELEAAGSLEYAPAISRLSGEGNTVDLVTFDQHLLYTPSWSPPGASFKWGAGWNLTGLTRNGIEYGANAIVGVKAIAQYESAKGYSYLKLGTVMNSTGVSLENYQVTAGGGWRLNPALGYQSWSVTGEISSLRLNSRLNGDSTRIQTYFMGLGRSY